MNKWRQEPDADSAVISIQDAVHICQKMTEQSLNGLLRQIEFFIEDNCRDEDGELTKLLDAMQRGVTAAANTIDQSIEGFASHFEGQIPREHLPATNDHIRNILSLPKGDQLRASPFGSRLAECLYMIEFKVEDGEWGSDCTGQELVRALKEWR